MEFFLFINNLCSEVKYFKIYSHLRIIRVMLHGFGQ